MRFLRSLLLASIVGSSALVAGCDDAVDSSSDDVTDIKNSDVERQSIGNCWLYATASWVESMHLSATGETPDLSQSYWTYWHWFDQIVQEQPSEIQTGGNEWVSFDIIRDRGLMAEGDFVPEDSTSEMSSRQKAALDKINVELKSGRLKDSKSRSDEALVRQVLDEAWGLSTDVRAQLDQAFGADGTNTFQRSGSAEGTKITAPSDYAVQYPVRAAGETQLKDTTLDVAVDDWRTANYPSWSSDSAKRDYQIRVQKAMHDGAPLIITWSVDFNAMESSPSSDLRGSFNMTTLSKLGAGRQGGHMTVLEDYEAETEEFGTLEAGVTLDPSNADDAAKLEAALLPSTTIKFWRIKNSWGAFRDDRASAPGMPGFHDLYMDYMNGPITWCPSVEGAKTKENCRGKETPWENVVLPPGY
jgi:hypothetical protein